MEGLIEVEVKIGGEICREDIPLPPGAEEAEVRTHSVKAYLGTQKCGVTGDNIFVTPEKPSRYSFTRSSRNLLRSR